MNSSSLYYPDYARDSMHIRAVIISVYATIFIISLLGNSAVVLIVTTVSSMHTITNVFITNLAVSDILMTLVATPFTPLAVFTDHWSLPASLCKILPLVMALSVYVSTLTSMAIALDRYFLLVHPCMHRMSWRLCGCVIVCVWLAGLFISLPLAVYQQKEPTWLVSVPSKMMTIHSQHNSSNSSSVQEFVCLERWPHDSSRQVFSLVSCCLQLIVPSGIIIYCYYRVRHVLMMRLNYRRRLVTASTVQERRETRRTQRTNHMLLAMSAVFVMNWIPLNVLWIVQDSVKEWNENPYRTMLFCVCHLFAMSSAVYNPLLYAGMNYDFRRQLRRLWLRLLRRQEHPEVMTALPGERVQRNLFNCDQISTL